MVDLLIVDDSPDDRETFKRLISREAPGRFQLTEAATGADAIATCRTKSQDCILLDYSLPDRDGLVLLTDLKQTCPTAAFVVLTGHGSEHIAVDAMKAGAHDYLVKGEVSASQLIRSIRNAIALERRGRQIEQQRKSLEIFTRALAHDLKEPLRTIKSFADIVRRGTDESSQAYELLGYLLRSATNMEGLINGIMRYTSLESIGELRFERIPMEDTIKTITANLHGQISSRQARVVDEGAGFVNGDRPLITQLLQNLVSNAIHHCTETVPEIRIRTTETDRQVQLIVSDNGPGIAEEFHDRIFEPFERLVSRDREGSGLGLAICQRIVELHGGAIRCLSVPGQGATFIASFPKLAPAV